MAPIVERHGTGTDGDRIRYRGLCRPVRWSAFLTTMTSDGGRDPKRRVVLSDMSRILAAIVRDLIGRQPDLVWVGHVALAELPTALPSLQPDVLVLAAPRSDRERAAREELRKSAPDLTVVEIRPRDDRAVLWRPRSGPEQVELSTSGIVDALRARGRVEDGGALAS